MPRAKRGSGGIALPTFSPSVTVMRYRSGERPNPFSAIGPLMTGERNKERDCAPFLDGHAWPLFSPCVPEKLPAPALFHVQTRGHCSLLRNHGHLLTVNLIYHSCTPGTHTHTPPRLGTNLIEFGAGFGWLPVVVAE